MNEEALKEILRGHIHYIALLVVISNVVGFLANVAVGAIIGYNLNRRFRKLEVGLKALEAKDKAKIDYLHPKQADAAIEILNVLNKIEGRFNHTLLSESLVPYMEHETNFDINIRFAAEKAVS